MTKRMGRLNVADGILRARPAPNPTYVHRWIDELDQWQSAFYNLDPIAPGALHLTEAQTMAREARAAIQVGDAERAAWAGMRLVHAMWIAQTKDAMPMIAAGVKARRAAEDQGEQQARAAAKLHEQWQNEASAAWAANPRLSKRDAAGIVASKLGGDPETIRKSLTRPGMR